MSQLRYGQLFARIIDRPLLILPRHATAMWNGLCHRFGDWANEAPLSHDAHAEIVDERLARILAGEGRANMSQFVGEALPREDGRGREPYVVQNGVGILPVIGELVNRGAWVGANSGLVSYEGIKFQLERMRSDDRVRSVILDIDSPGGEAVGFELAAQAVQRLAAEKRVVAVVNGMAASAAYALASGATKIVTGSTGVSGSIGVVMMHVDMSRALENEGVTPTLIFAGEHKVDGNPFAPLPENVREDLQREVNGFYDAFVKLVASGRAGKMSASDAKATEARTYIGKDAITAKLADEIGTFEDVLSDLASKQRNRRISKMGRRTSAENETPTIDEIDTVEPKSEANEFEFGGVEFQDVTGLVEKARNDANARILAILSDERSEGRERFAINLACEAPDMDVEKVLALAEKAGLASAPKIRPLAERHGDTGAASVTSSPFAEDAKPKPNWSKAVDQVNKRVSA